MKFFTSDLHVKHKNIVKFTNRGKDTTQENHENWLRRVWNAQVSHGDLVYHLGDFSFNNDIDYLSNYINSLNGQKIFIKGNHDNRDTFDTLVELGVIAAWYDYKEIQMKDQKYKAVLFHFPIGSWHKQSKGSIHLHGHSHGNYMNSRGRMLDVGIDNAYNLYGEHRFFTEDEIVKSMEKQPIYIADHHRESV